VVAGEMFAPWLVSDAGQENRSFYSEAVTVDTLKVSAPSFLCVRRCVFVYAWLIYLAMPALDTARSLNESVLQLDFQ